jgi:adenine deaminase
MNLSRLSTEDLRVPAQPGMLRVIGVMEGTLLTRKILSEPKISDGHVVSDISRDILKMAVYNRYTADRPPAVGFVQGIGIREGAIATTVAHDSHNLIVVGASDSAMIRVADAVRNSGGGIAIGGESGPVLHLALPVAGLMSSLSLHDVVDRLGQLKARSEALGSPLHNPFMALSFLALPVIPELKLTDLGLVDVSTFSFVSLFEP